MQKVRILDEQKGLICFIQVVCELSVFIFRLFCLSERNFMARNILGGNLLVHIFGILKLFSWKPFDPNLFYLMVYTLTCSQAVGKRETAPFYFHFVPVIGNRNIVVIYNQLLVNISQYLMHVIFKKG